MGKTKGAYCRSLGPISKVGMMDVSCKFYEGGRHEMLNETNKEEVYEDVVKWLNDHM